MNRVYQIDEQTYFDPISGTFLFLPEIIHFSTDRSILADSSPAIVSWEVKGATSVTINDEVVINTGHKSFYTRDALSVVLSAVNQIGLPVKRTLTIRAERVAPIIGFFNIDRDFVIRGMPVKLSWSVTGAARIEIDNNIGNVTGKTTIDAIVGATGVFNLIAYNHFGDKAFASISVSVFPMPIIAGVFFGRPKFSIKPINIQKLCFISIVSVSGNISDYKLPDIELVRFDKTILLNRLPVNFVLFQGNKFMFSQSNHTGIITIIKTLWKKIFKSMMTGSMQ